MENRVGIRKNSTIKMMASRTEFTLSLIIIALFFFAFFFTKAFGSPYNLTNLAKQGAIIGVLAVAQTSVIITGGIDISGGSIAGLGCMVMPPMILQPLVENAIKHGLGMVLQGGCIWVRVTRADRRVEIRVEDNGVGMEQEKIDTLMDHIKRLNTESEHIGLRNIYMRLKYFYDDDVDFDITRTDGLTTVQFSLPCKEQGWPWPARLSTQWSIRC